MVLAEATVRVSLEVSRFEKELRDRVQSAATRAGRDFDREMKSQLATSGRNASTSFRDAVRTGVGRAGREAARDFDLNLRQGLSQTGGRVAQRLSQGLRVGVSRAGLDAGRGFADNLTQTLTSSGRAAANSFINAIGSGINSRGATIGRQASQRITNALVSNAGIAGRSAARQFSLNFGIGSAGAGRPLLAGLAVLGGAAADALRPTLGIVAALPGSLAAVTAAAIITVTAFEGIGDALKAVTSGDIEKLSAAMDGLSPAAQAFVREFASIRPLLGQLRTDIQDAFFTQILGQTRQLAGAFAGPLRNSIVGVAAAAGGVASAFVGAFTELEGVNNLDRFLRGTGNLLRQLAPGIRDLARGFADFIGQTGPGLNSIGRELGRLLTRFGQFLSRTAESGQALRWVEGGIQGLRDLTATVVDVGRSIGVFASALQPLAFAMGGILGLVNTLVQAFGNIPGPIQTALLAALLLTRSGLPNFLSTTVERAGGVATSFQQIGNAYRNTTVPLQAFLAQQQMLHTVVGQSPSLIQRAGGAFQGLAIQAAGAAAAVGRGLAGAFTGLVGALGGPWGVAIAAAGIGLSVLASQQDKARQVAAAHSATVSQLVDTLNRQTGAVTASTRALAAQQFSQGDLGNAVRRLGVDLRTVSDAATGGVSSQQRLSEALRNSARGAIQAADRYQLLQLQARNLGVSENELLDAFLGNAAALNTVGQAADRNGARLDAVLGAFSSHIPDQQLLGRTINSTAGDLDKQAAALRAVAATMTPAQLAAQKYSDALGILADNTASADQKARALNEALNILAGGTIDAEVAQGRFTELLRTMDERLQDSVKGLTGMGNALLTNEGRINTSSQAGAFLIDTYQQLSSNLSTTAAATVEAGRASGDLDGALIKVAQQAQAARDQFIQTARSLGINEAEANKLADAYGLIPAQVLTTVSDQGTAQNVQFQVAGVFQRLKDLPPNTPVTVSGLTDDAIKKLNEVGIKTEKLPDGQVKVTAETQDAKNSLQGLINSFSGRVINFVTNLIPGKAAGDIIENAKGNIVGYANGGTHRKLTRMSANRAQIVPPNTWRVIGDRARGDEAYIPLTNSARSHAILAEAARRMGFTLLADGGVTGRDRSNSPSLQVAAGAIVVNAPFADPQLVARATLNELARQAVS